MTEQPQPYGLEPRACPFVALVDDRDRRLDQPDPRHRCFAEPDPQPRAEAHQRAYCLSPAFTACPIFLDWASRAAADPLASRPAAPTHAQLARPTDVGPPPRPTDPASRAWAAPPPWSGAEPRPRPTPAGEQLAVFEEAGDGPDPDQDLMEMAAASRAAAVSAAASGIEATPGPDGDDGARRQPPPVPGGGPGSPSGSIVAAGAAAAVAGVVASAPGVTDPLSNPPMQSVEPAPPSFLAGRDRPAAPVAAIATIPPATPPRAPQASVGQPDDGLTGRDQAGRVPVKKVDPDWIRSGRREEYPKLRTRIGLRHIPVAVALIAGIGIVVVSLVLLAGFLGQGTTTLPSSQPSGSPTPTAAPTPTPTPSPVTYTVESGDTLEAIAKDFGLTIDQVACANGITDPNLLQVGQVLVIPDDEFQCPGASAEPTDSE